MVAKDDSIHEISTEAFVTVKTFWATIASIVTALAAVAVFVLGLHSANPHKGAIRRPEMDRVDKQLSEIKTVQKDQGRDIREILMRISKTP